MADIRIKVSGDASGGAAALKSVAVSSQDVSRSMSEMRVRFADMSRSAHESVGGIDRLNQRMTTFARVTDSLVTGALTAAISGLKNFITSSVSDFRKAEQAHNTLAHAAKEMTGVYDELADSLSKKLAVDDDEIRSIETLLVQYGVAAEQIEKTTVAIVDFSIASGKDATSAARTLLSAVESGSDGIAKLGVQFDATGDKGKDLELAVDGINKKFGGTAEANANTLVGRSTAAGIAFDNSKKALGGFIATMLDESGVVEGFTTLMDGLTEKIKSFSTTAMAAKQLGIDFRKDFGAPLKQRGESDTAPALSFDDEDSTDIEGKFTSKKDAIARADKLRTEAFNKLISDNEANVEAMRKFNEEEAREAEKALKARFDKMKKVSDAEDAWHKDRENALRQMTAKADAETQRQIDEFSRQAQAYEQAGASIGAAFVSAFASELSKLAEGGEFDVVSFVAGLFSVIGGIVGSVIAPGVGTAIGAAIGGLAGAGFKAAANSGKPKKRHEGGAIEYYHSGGWPLERDEVPAILQQGEHVLSKNQVKRMGGHGGVMSAAGAGGGSVNLYISTVDAKGTREFFEGQGGRGFRGAIKGGRGDVARLFDGKFK